MKSRFRYERKFAIDTSLTDHVKYQLLSNHTFHTQYPNRFVNSLYWDTHELSYAQHSIDGIPNRIKIRHRWYGNLLPITKPALEIKSKSGHLVKKSSTPIKSFPKTNQIQKLFNKNYSPKHQALLSTSTPTALVRYQRQYFIDRHGIRLTIDTQLRTANLNSMQIDSFTFQDHPHAIIELKYSPHLDSIARQLTQLLPLRLTQSSKYISSLMF